MSFKEDEEKDKTIEKKENKRDDTFSINQQDKSSDVKQKLDKKEIQKKDVSSK